MARKSYFVTATGTNIGKTFVTAKIVQHALRQGLQVNALKPVISGFKADQIETTDTGRLLQAMQLPRTVEQINAISPWRYEAPLSPDIAADREGETIGFNDLIDYCLQTLERKNDLTLIEGVGGVMVPLDHEHTVINWMAGLQIPVILVAGNYLGSISHTLTAWHALQFHHIPVAAIVISESPTELPVNSIELIQSLKHFIKQVPFFLLPAKIQDEDQEQFVFDPLLKHLLGTHDAAVADSKRVHEETQIELADAIT